MSAVCCMNDHHHTKLRGWYCKTGSACVQILYTVPFDLFQFVDWSINCPGGWQTYILIVEPIQHTLLKLSLPQCIVQCDCSATSSFSCIIMFPDDQISGECYQWQKSKSLQRQWIELKEVWCKSYGVFTKCEAKFHLALLHLSWKHVNNQNFNISLLLSRTILLIFLQALSFFPCLSKSKVKAVISSCPQMASMSLSSIYSCCGIKRESTVYGRIQLMDFCNAVWN